MTIAEKITRAKSDYDEVYEAGKKAESDAFWDNFQENGNRTNYTQGFTRWGSFEYIRPKYKVIPTATADNPSCAYNVIYDCNSLKKIEADYFDFSQVPYGTTANQSHSYQFATCDNLEEIEDVGLQPSFSYSYFAAFCGKLRKVACVRVDKNSMVSNMFASGISLEEVKFEGEIGQSGINLYRSTKLNRASIESLINCLSKDTTGQSITLSKTAVNNAFTTDEWNALVATKSNWTISLA